MSNVKRVSIKGDLNTMAVSEASSQAVLTSFGSEMLVKGHNIPTDKVPEACEESKVIERFLMTTTFPHFGLKIRFGNGGRSEPNGYNGVTRYFNYEIYGDEAIAYAFYDMLVKALRVFGNVRKAKIVDLEA
jgi:hypothetical protein